MNEEEKKVNSEKKKEGNNSAEKSTEIKRNRKAEGDSKAEKELEAKKVTAKVGHDSSFYIVGMCASAGGLEAFEKFFKNMPPDSGMAFILVPHLDPTHKSMMADLIRRCTKMKVFEAEDGRKVAPNNVYIIPPDKNLALFHRRLQVMETDKPRGQRQPIDYFLRALGEDLREKAIGIIFSGTGTDGTVGLKSVKEAGGMIMVQDPVSAKYSGMPQSAINTDLVDYVLPPEKMPEQLIKYINHFRAHTRRKEADVIKEKPDTLQKIFVLLHSHTGNDFSLYKKSTVMRRIERRMSVYQIDKLSRYARFLQENPQEINTLFKELLIGVTNFFRDPEAFEIFKTKVCPELAKARAAKDPIRIWVAGCSTGEEAYSIAITFKEFLQEEVIDAKVQIFATDIDEDSVETARAGIFPDSIAVDVSPERLRRFFTKEGNAYRVDKGIREMIIFSNQNLIKDPPFSRLDMISCRNLLIYLDTDLQKKIFPLFHYALKPRGILFLGSSETIGTFVDLFDVFDKRWKFYRRKESLLPFHPAVEFPGLTVRADFTRTQPHEGENKKEETPKLSDLIERILLESYAPPCVIINPKGDITYISGRTGMYLEPAPGEAKMNILEMAREGLKDKLQLGIRKCISKNSEVIIKNVHVKVNGGFQPVNLTVRPVHSVYRENLIMVLFEDVTPPKTVVESQAKHEGNTDHERHIQKLEQELKHTRENLQITIEELETANEELKSTNEELQSSNEELQSTNEELETAKEETQSLNEELVTVNSELQDKIDELTRSANDLKNLLDSTHVATVFIDNNLRIKRFTPVASKVVNLIDSDAGRPIDHVTTNLIHDKLIEDIQGVIQNLSPFEREVQTKGGNWYLMKIRPYRTVDNVIDGVVITFLDIHQQRESQSLYHAHLYAEAITNAVREPLIALDNDLRVISANRSFYETFQVAKEETEKKLIYELGNGQWDIPKLRELLEDIIPQNSQFHDFLVEHDFQSIGHRSMLLNACRIDFEAERDSLILLAVDDVTDRKEVS